MRSHAWGKRVVASLLTSTLLTLLAACGDRVLPPNAPNVARLCGAKCERLAACRQGWDVATCEQDCRRDPLTPYFRDDYVEAIAQCFQTSTCEAVLATSGRSCWQKTKPEPTDVARRACMVATAKDRLCTGSPLDVEGCLARRRWGVLKDSVLTQLADCEDQPCGKSRRDHCIQVSLGEAD